MGERKREYRLAAYSIGINMISLAVAGAFIYLGRVILGILAFIATVSILLAAVYRREMDQNSQIHPDSKEASTPENMP